MTCPVMYGNGVRIGTMRIITKTASKTTREGLVVEVRGCFAAAPGTLVRGACVRRSATRASHRAGASTAGFAWACLPSSYFLSSEFLFYESFNGRDG